MSAVCGWDSHHSDVSSGVSGVVSGGNDEGFIDQLQLALREAIIIISCRHTHRMVESAQEECIVTTHEPQPCL